MFTARSAVALLRNHSKFRSCKCAKWWW